MRSIRRAVNSCHREAVGGVGAQIWDVYDFSVHSQFLTTGAALFGDQEAVV